MPNRGCGRLIRKGELAWDRWGIILCDQCDKDTPAPHLAVYHGGLLKRTMTCGQTVTEAKQKSK